MGKETPQPLFVENLGVGELAWLSWQWTIREPRVRACRTLFVIYQVSRWARRLAALLGVFGMKIKIREMSFDFHDDVWLPDGTRAVDEVYLKAVPMILGRLERDPQYVEAIRGLVRKASHENALHVYVSKQIFRELAGMMNSGLRSVVIVAWYCRTQLGTNGSPHLLFVKRTWLFSLMADYARQWSVQLCPLPVGKSVTWDGVIRGLRRHVGQVSRTLRGVFSSTAQFSGDVPVRIATEIYTASILMREFIYDAEALCWYREPNLPRGAVFGYFALPANQPGPSRQARLREAGIDWVDRRILHRLRRFSGRRHVHEHPGATAAGTRPPGGGGPTAMQRVLGAYLKDFYVEYDRWHHFFSMTKTRIHVSIIDLFPESEALHAALADVGGVSVSLQRSIEQGPFVGRRTVTDVHFAFSQAQADREFLSGSSVRQFITAGYLYDDAFPAARSYARRLTAELRSRGVTFIVCFFDENEGIHPKWLGGEKVMHEDYEFLCERLEQDKTLGLILKPKNPQTLKERLGPLWSRVQRVRDSGRCLYLDFRSLDERYLPCVAACAADVSINLAGGATAALESYLAGTKALLIRHGVGRGIFGRLPEHSVIFDTWRELWHAVERFRVNPADPHIGNWEPIIEEFASLRDGYASKRINSYLTWLYEALAAGRTREEAMAHAGNRYTSRWGADRITEITQPPLGQSHEARTTPSANCGSTDVVETATAL